MNYELWESAWVKTLRLRRLRRKAAAIHARLCSALARGASQEVNDLTVDSGSPILTATNSTPNSSNSP